MVVRIDLHAHSRHSPDSAVEVGAYVRRLTGAGLHGLALTDHNTVAGHRELSESARDAPGALLLPGVEVSTVEGHLLVYGVRELPPVARPLAETLDWVRDHAGASILAHPFRWSHGVGRRVAETAPAHGIEVTNGHNSPRANRRAAELAVRRQVAETGGSDAHTLAQFGRAFTEFPDGTATNEEVLEAIRQGRAKAGGSGPGAIERAQIAARSGVLRLRRGFRRI